jgi:uncharacterized protein
VLAVLSFEWQRRECASRHLDKAHPANVAEETQLKLAGSGNGCMIGADYASAVRLAALPRRYGRQELRRIKITAGPAQAFAELNETKTATAIWAALPITAKGMTWGDEIYFSIPVEMETEKGQAVVDLGDLGYWEPGSAFCIFFGPTPSSQGDEIRPASPVTVFGKLEGDPKVFKKTPNGAKVAIERAS